MKFRPRVLCAVVFPTEKQINNVVMDLINRVRNLMLATFCSRSDLMIKV